jgi:hypothetical protein
MIVLTRVIINFQTVFQLQFRIAALVRASVVRMRLKIW